jgi:hypothetical protein
MSEPEFNPYAVPASPLVLPPSLTSARIEGAKLAIPKDWQSPPVCLLSGDIQDLTPLRRARLTWMNPGFLLFIFLSPILFVLIALLVQKKGKIYYHLSAAQAAQRKQRLQTNWTLFASAVLAFVAAYIWSSIAAGAAGVVLLLLCLILAVTWCRLLKVAKIDKTTIWLTGIPFPVMLRIVQAQDRGFQTPVSLINSL